MTSGTHVCEVPGTSGGLPLRIIDTEGLSHVGRSRKNEALVRQFLISTYLTSSWIIWLDTEVLSSGFFNTMWLVQDYVIDILRIREASGAGLPGLIYVRTQETDVQQLEYRDEFVNFSNFFDKVLEGHEDAHILTQMFAPGKIHGHTLPVWAMEDLESFKSGGFWKDSRSSPFKDAVAALCNTLGSQSEGVTGQTSGPPLLALSDLSKHLPKIAKLEKFDPRDHEENKNGKLRAQLRSAYGSPLRSPLWLADLFDPEDKDVIKHGFRIRDLAMARIQAMCVAQRLDPEVADADPDVMAVLDEFSKAQKIFDAALEAFTAEHFSEKSILLRAICFLHLDASALATELWASFAEAEELFLSRSGLPRTSLRELRLHQRVKWRIEDVVSQLRGRAAKELRLRNTADKNEFDHAPVWSIGEWPGLVKGATSRSKVHRPKYVLWTDGTSWRVYEEKLLKQRGGEGFAIGELFDEGRLTEEQGTLPVPPSCQPREESHELPADSSSQAPIAHMV